MAYNILLTDGATLTSVADATVDTTTTNLSLIGRNYAGFGQFLNENFIYLLENASSSVAPSKPLVGQLWWDKANAHLNVWQGTNWKVISSSMTGASAPVNPVVGDFWWNTSSGQFSVYNGSQWIAIGPATLPGQAVTGMLINLVSDGVGTHYVGNVVINNKLSAIFSADSVAFNPVSPSGGITTINPGLNMVAGSGITSPTVTAANLIVTNNTVLNQLAVSNIATSTFYANATSTLNVANISVINATTLNVANNSVLTGNLTVSGNTNLNYGSANFFSATSFQQNGHTVLDSSNYGSYVPASTGTGASGTWGINITGTAAYASHLFINGSNAESTWTYSGQSGQPTYLWGTNDGSSMQVWNPSNFTVANSGTVWGTGNNSFVQGYTTAQAWSIAQRDSGGNLTANYFYGTATNAEYADLAERFESDAVYPVGTVMEIGGDNEVTISNTELSENIIGVISTDPAYLMNHLAGSNETHPPIALAGRVPVRVVGPVNKGDRLVSAGNGCARAAVRSATLSEITAFNVIGRALETKTDSDEGLIEAIVRVNV